MQAPKMCSSALRITNQTNARLFSTEKDVKAEDTEKPDEPKQSSAVAKYDYDEYDDYEEPKTAGGWVRQKAILT